MFYSIYGGSHSCLYVMMSVSRIIILYTLNLVYVNHIALKLEEKEMSQAHF